MNNLWTPAFNEGGVAIEAPLDLPSDIGARADTGTRGQAKADHSHRGLAYLLVGTVALRGSVELLQGTGITISADEDEHEVTISVADGEYYTQDETDDLIAGIHVGDLADVVIGSPPLPNDLLQFSASPAEWRSTQPYWLELAGGTMSGDINMDGNNVLNAAVVDTQELWVDELHASAGSPSGVVNAYADVQMNSYDLAGAGVLDAQEVWTDALHAASGSPTGDINVNANLFMATNAIGYDDEALTFDAGNEAYFANDVTFNDGIIAAGAYIQLGVNNSNNGYLRVYGDGGASAWGGLIELWTADAYNETIQRYQLRAYQDDFEIRQQATTRLTLRGGTNDWLFGADIEMGGNSIWDVGSVVADGVWTDVLDAASGSPSGVIDVVAPLAMTANIVMGGNILTGLGAGSANGESVRYEQVIGVFLPLAGGTMAGHITMDGNSILTAGHLYVNDGAAVGISGNETLVFNAAGTIVVTGALFDLETTSSTTGQITQGGTRLLHTYGGADSVYLGTNAGNFTASGASDMVGIGDECLIAITTADGGVFIGSQSAYSMKTGNMSVGIGFQCMFSSTGNAACVGLGAQSLYNCTGSWNVGAGWQTLYNCTSGAGNIGVGYRAGYTLTTADYGVYLGYYAGRFETGSNKLFIDNQGRSNEADGRVKALIYGEFDAATANQLVRFNAKVEVRETLTMLSGNLIMGANAIGNDAAVMTFAAGAAGQTTVTGDFALVNTAAAKYVIFDTGTGATHLVSGLLWRHGGTTRWLLRKGATANDDLFLMRYNDAGAFQGQTYVDRTDGKWFFEAGLRVATTTPVEFRDAALKIYSRADGYLSILADTAIEVGDQTSGNYTLFESDGAPVFYGTAGLPYGEIYVRDNAGATTIAVAGTFVQFTGFTTNGASNNATPDHTNDHITITKAGHYLVTLSIAVLSVGGGGADTIEIEVRKNNGATVFNNLHGHRKLAGGGGDQGSMSISGIIDGAVNDTVEVWVANDDNPDDVILEDVTLSLVQVGGT